MLFSKKREYRAYYVEILGVYFVTFLGPHPHGYADANPIARAEKVFEQAGISVKTFQKPDGENEVEPGLILGWLVMIIDFYEDELFAYLHVFNKSWEFEGQIFVLDKTQLDENQDALKALKFRN